MNVTFIERKPGVFRLRIETGVDVKGARQFRYETLHGTADDAARRRFAILNDHEEGTFAEPSKVTFDKFFRHWVETRRVLQKITRATAENYITCLEAYLAPIAGKRVQKITAQDVQHIYVALARRGLSQATVHHVHVIVGAAFRAARRAKVIKVNPMEEIEAPQRPRPAPRALTEEQVRKLLATLAGTRLELVVTFILATGLRRGETCGLRWGDVDLDAGRIAVRSQLRQYQGGDHEVTHTKSDAGTRVVSIAGGIVDQLRTHRIEAAQRRLAAGLGGKLDEQFVFTLDGEAPLLPSTLGDWFRDHCHEHGFDAGITLHKLRHTHITHLLARVGKAGAKAVSVRAGHSDITTTLSIYQTVFEHDDRALADLSSNLFFTTK